MYVVVEQLVPVQSLELARQFTSAELVSIKAGIKSAFMRFRLHLDSICTFAMEWDGWVFVFNRTCFGWKYATHTFSDFTKAIKLKTQGFNRNGWLIDAKFKMNTQWRRVVQRLHFHHLLPEHLKSSAAQSRMDYLTLAYVDDVWSHTSKDLGRAEKLAAGLRMSDFLLLGYNGWNVPKAEKDGTSSLV